MNLQQLMTFTTVVAEGSMTAAAEKLYLTQPAVSQQIRNLEEELGVNLLVRGVRQAKPTVQGQMLFDYAKKIIALTQAAQVAVQTLGEGIQGTLRVGALNSLGLYLLSPLVGTFLKQNPKVSLRLQYDKGPEILKALQKGEIDVAILPEVRTEYGQDPSGLDERPLLKDEVWLVASSRATNAQATASLRDLEGQPLALLRGEYPGFDKRLQDLVSQFGVKLNSTFETNNVGTMKKVIESGLGWGFVPAHSVRKQVRAGRLVQIEIAELKYGLNVLYYFRKGEANMQVVDVFYNALKPSGSAREA
ncbi:MAG: LysR family transcriptional regulator [Bdellovibrionaceae bacterium]|nr:LysR family transcriptional regulator [Pseudobdellovibrionaceae bacterium]